MELEAMKEWLLHGETREFLEKGDAAQGEWVTIFRKRHGVFDYDNIVPILADPRQLVSCLHRASWGNEYTRSKPKLLLRHRNRTGFLSKAFLKCHPGSRIYGSECLDKKRELIAKVEYGDEHTWGGGKTEVKMRRDVLRETTEKIGKILILGVDATRFSERTLTELGLKDQDWEYAGDAFRYDLSVRADSSHYESGRDMFSTITRVMGKKVVRL